MKKKKTKRIYRLRNWKHYNAALVRRGSLTFWVSEDLLTVWRNTEKTGKPGHPRRYSDTAVLCMATLKEVYHLPLRATEGLMISMMKLLDLDLPVLHYSQLSRRCAVLEVALPRFKSNEPLHLVVDSTGVKVFGEGEWKVRQHGYTKRRTWRKLHLGADETTGEIVAAVVTTNNIADSQVIEDLLEQVDEQIEQVSGDGSYDKRNCYEAIGKRQAKAAIPPRRDAKIWQHANTKQERLIRDENAAEDPASGSQTVEAGSGLSSAESGRDADVSGEDHIRRSSQREAVCRASDAGAGQVCGVEPDDAVGNA